MKRIISYFLSLSLLANAFNVHAEWSERTFNFDGKDRHYWIYIPPSYTASKPTSVVVTLHGMGDNATNFKSIGFNYIADTANIIVLVPDALVDGLTGMTSWNSQAGIGGFYYPSADVDDIGFINAMVDSTQAQYAVNPAKIYVCGFSMGGFMTQKLALMANEKFAAFASIAGTIGSGIEIPSTVRPLPMAHFHGTVDATVGYDTNTFGSNVKELIDYWVANNECDTSPTHTALPNTKADGYTVDHFVYAGGKKGTVVELFRINNAGHDWLGMDNDIAYIVELWRFFNKFTLPLSIETPDGQNLSFSVFPNPAQNEIHIQLIPSATPYSILLTDAVGRKIWESNTLQNSLEIPTVGLSKGMYFIKVSNGKASSTQKIVVQH